MWTILALILGILILKFIHYLSENLTQLGMLFYLEPWVERARPFAGHLDTGISSVSMCQSVETLVSKILPFKAYDLSCSPNTSNHTPSHPRGFLILKRWTLRTEGIQCPTLLFCIFLSSLHTSRHKPMAWHYGLALKLGMPWSPKHMETIPFPKAFMVSQLHGAWFLQL